MSCIVALSSFGKIYMGSDKCISYGDEQRNYESSKIFIRGNYLIGAVGSPRPFQVLINYWKPPAKEYKITESIKNILLKYGCITQNEDQIEIMPMSLIIAHYDSIFEISSDFQKNYYSDNYSSIGCGRPYALASLYTTNKLDLIKDNTFEDKQVERVITALKCSEYFCMGIRRPFDLYSNEKPFSGKYKKLEIKS